MSELHDVELPELDVTPFEESAAMHIPSTIVGGEKPDSPELAWLEARWKSALAEGMDGYSNAIIVALEALKSYGGNRKGTR